MPGPYQGWEAKTDRNGVAILHPNHPPRALGIGVDDPVDSWGCSQVIFCTEDLLAKGFVAADKCWGALHGSHPEPPPKIAASPGDVYIFVHMVSRWSWAWNETIGSHYFGPRIKPPRPRRTGRTKTFYAREAILQHLEDLEDVYLAEEAWERIRRGEERTIPLKDALKRHAVRR